MNASPKPADADIRHIAWAYSLDDAPELPLTGDRHPLRRERTRWMTWANGVTLLVVLVVFAGWVLWSGRQPSAAPVARQVKIVRYTELGVPPSIARPAAPQINVAEAVAKIATPPPSIAVPEPVPDDRAQTRTIATVSEMAEALAPITFENTGSGEGGDSLVVVRDIDTSPAPDQFVAVDVEPVRISIANPVYPDVARTAGVEGTVEVRVLVGKDGKVKNVIYMNGPEALKKAAIDCARTAVFRPALVDQKPLEVWVMMPVTFKLR